MSTLNNTYVLTGAEVARECGITRQGFELWIKDHGHQHPPDFTLKMGAKTISAWLPSSAARILEARQP